MLFLTLLLSATLYWQRTYYDNIVSAGRMGGFIFLFLSPLYLLWIIGIVYSIGATIKYTSSKINLLPFLFFVGLLLLSYRLPLPPLPETTYFFEHREEFESVVDYYYQYGFYQGVNGCEASDVYNVPEIFENVPSGCVRVFDDAVIELSPIYRGRAYSIVYIEKPDFLFSSRACQSRGYVWEQLDTQWFLCLETN